MARGIERLSAAFVRRTRKVGVHSDGGCLYLQVTRGPDGSIRKSWIFRYAKPGERRASRTGKEYQPVRNMGLGSASTFGLGEARDLARECRQVLARGDDPIEHREQERRRKAAEKAKEAAAHMTFDDCAAAYIEAHGATWRNAIHAAQWKTTLARYASPDIGTMQVCNVDTPHVLKVLRTIWSKKPETASRLRGRIEAVLDWARVAGHRGDGDNPARWRGHLDKALPRRSKVAKVEHHAALPYAELPAFMAALRQREGVGALALEFAILTAARTGEVTGATWDEVDLDQKTWTVPPGRMKASAEHRVPFSGAALAVLGKVRGITRDIGGAVGASALVFPNDRNGAQLSENALLATLKRMGRADVTTHGFRSSFRDWAAETTSFPSDIVEMALAHTIKNKVEAAYRRGHLFAKRVKLMDAWASYCGRPAAAGDVVPMKRRTA